MHTPQTTQWCSESCSGNQNRRTITFRSSSSDENRIFKTIQVNSFQIDHTPCIVTEFITSFVVPLIYCCIVSTWIYNCCVARFSYIAVLHGGIVAFCYSLLLTFWQRNDVAFWPLGILTLIHVLTFDFLHFGIFSSCAFC